MTPPQEWGLGAGAPLLSQLHMQQEALHATETNAETHLEAGVRGHPAPLPHPTADPQIPRPEEQVNSHELVPSNFRTSLDFREWGQILS